jgi:DNA polymerase (family 10)
MLSNKEIARVFRLASQLMELHEENAFKVRSMQNAAFKIERLQEPVAGMNQDSIAALEGIGKSTAQKIMEISAQGSFQDLNELVAKTPSGVVDMLSIKGIGPKKVIALWKGLGIESVGELLYACNENRLVELKGFGAKTQEQIRQSIEYAQSNEGKFHYALVEIAAMRVLQDSEALPWCKQISFTGALRRKCEVLECAELLLAVDDSERCIGHFQSIAQLDPDSFHHEVGVIRFKLTTGIPFEINLCSSDEFSQQLFKTTGNNGHLEWLTSSYPSFNLNGSSEDTIYSSAGLPYLEPEFREGLFESGWIKNGALPQPIEYSDLKGTLHNHTTYSDGIHSLEEMAVYGKSMGYEYLGICDHSQSAFYANGLKAERILQQHEEINRLNLQLAPFVIFKGIESDILIDGALDYPEEILNSFDFIVASVHSVLRMDEAKATARLIKAIEHPKTTILGHPTGRLLLAREGYPIDITKVLDACAANDVIMELNANPYRLDLDWRHIPLALEKGIKISINPDAHRKEGYHDMHYGVCVARKGGLTREMTFNAMGAAAVADYFAKKRNSSNS